MSNKDIEAGEKNDDENKLLPEPFQKMMNFEKISWKKGFLYNFILFFNKII